jgi:prephenate dehydrogenase/cyclohexadieny/prephenate dehydrogenase
VSVLPFERVAIIGLGLMGGSLAKSLARLSPRPRVSACTLDDDGARQALTSGVVDAADAYAGAVVDNADLVVFATPVGTTLRLLGELCAAIPATALVTDVCSVKRPLAARAAGIGLAERFVGAHPLSGSQESGYGASRADLYDDVRVWIVPAPNEAATARVEAFWRAAGAQPARTTAEAHDCEMAWVSHLPQVLSSALGAALFHVSLEPARLGPGGKDMTRLAASDAALWTDILLHNRDALAEPLAALRSQLAEMAEALDAGDAAAVERLLALARSWART